MPNWLSKDAKDFAKYCMDKAPPHFWTKPSSSSGKYHPPDEHGEGGLVLHTIRVEKIAEILIGGSTAPLWVDAVRLAALLHDVARYGLEEEPDEHSNDSHPELAEKFLIRCWEEQFPALPPGFLGVACQAIRRHMGRWGKHDPITPEDWIVHNADNIAAKYVP